jgi:hypothetical protein
MIKIKLSEVINNLENLQNLFKNKLPVKVAYRLKRLSAKLDSELKAYDETKNAMILEIAKDLPDNTKITSENVEELKEFNKRHAELLAEEIEIDFEQLSVEELGDVVVAPNELVPFIFKD